MWVGQGRRDQTLLLQKWEFLLCQFSRKILIELSQNLDRKLYEAKQARAAVLKLYTYVFLIYYFEFLKIYFRNHLWKSILRFLANFLANFIYFILWIFFRIKIILLLKSLRTTGLGDSGYGEVLSSGWHCNYKIGTIDFFWEIRFA